MINTGLSFSPTDQSNDPTKPKGSGNPVQDAIQLLSFRLPSFLGASAPPLQGSQTALGSQIGGGIVESWLRRFFGGQGGPSVPGTGPVSRSPGATTQYGTPGGGAVVPDSGAHIGAPTPIAPPQLAPNTPPAYSPSAPSPLQRSGGSFQDWPDTRLGGGRSQ